MDDTKTASTTTVSVVVEFDDQEMRIIERRALKAGMTLTDYLSSFIKVAMMSVSSEDTT